jgi:sigma-B regulation protein RsbQ
MSIIERNNVHVSGTGSKAMMFAHGFGCDQNMWRFVAPSFEPDYRVVLFDHVGAGGSDLSAYKSDKYASLSDYADDVVEIGRELGLKNAVFVGHSVSAMIGALASLKAPDMFESLVMVGPSPRTLTMATTSAASLNPKSRSCWNRSPTITWAGLRLWRPQSWVTQIVPSLVRN